MNTPFISVLFDSPKARDDLNTEGGQDYFHDLGLDQIISEIIEGRESYDLLPFFDSPAAEISTIEHRHEVFRDLRDREIFDSVTSFCAAMRKTHARVSQAQKLHNSHQIERWYLDAVVGYCKAVEAFKNDLSQLKIRSQGLVSLREFLIRYVGSDEFQLMVKKGHDLQNQLAKIRYNLYIRGNRITVTPYDKEVDFGSEVEETFDRFKKSEGKSYLVNFPYWPEMNHVEEEVLEIVVSQNRQLFDAVQSFISNNLEFMDDVISRFDLEVQFYLSYLEFIKPMESLGHIFCFPIVSSTYRKIDVRNAFDIALAQKLSKEGKVAVCNDYFFSDDEQVIVVSGPNSGGKTTFARCVGQIAYLAKLGCLVPASEASVYMFDQIFSHFEREENLDNLRGKLEDELVRMHGILDKATSRSLIIMNETFGSTTLEDAKMLGSAVIRRIIEIGARAICVSFIDELSTLSDEIVSMVALVSPEDPTIRTHKVVRKESDGLAYAYALAEKYRLGYNDIKGRIVK